MGRRNCGSWELWVVGIMGPVGIVGRQNCGSSELWVVGIVGRRNIGSSELWIVGIMSRRNYGYTPSRLCINWLHQGKGFILRIICLYGLFKLCWHDCYIGIDVHSNLL